MVGLLAERQGVWRLRRWCPIAKTYQNADDGECMWEYCVSNRPYHRLRLRRMLICSVVDCQQGYFNQVDFDAHECGSAY